MGILQPRIKRNKIKKTLLYIRQHVSSILLFLLMAVILLVPGAKALLLTAFIHTGVFNASPNKEIFLQAADYPALSFINENGDRLSTGSLRGKVLFINCWAAWCPPCVAEMVSINNLYHTLKADNRFVFIMADEDRDFRVSIPFMKKNGYDLPVYQASTALPASLFSGNLPTTFIIDANGNVLQKHEGMARYDTKKMEVFMRSLLPVSPTH